MKNFCLTLEIPAAHNCYADHFPTDPLVPGALLLQWIFEAVNQQLPQTFVESASNVKFLAPTRPGEHCSLDCQLNDDQDTINISCRNAAGVVALKGRFGLSSEGNAQPLADANNLQNDNCLNNDTNSHNDNNSSSGN